LFESKAKGLTAISRSWRTIEKASAPCNGFWPGDQADAHALLPVVAKVRQRFGLNRVCWVADRGMISANTIQELEDQGLEYILGARLRQQREVRDQVLGCPGRYRQVADNLRVKKVWVKGRR
jgi:hypothetical protein